MSVTLPGTTFFAAYAIWREPEPVDEPAPPSSALGLRTRGVLGACAAIDIAR
jgi:hypothetical protein